MKEHLDSRCSSGFRCSTLKLIKEGAIVINFGKSAAELRPLPKGYKGRVCTIDAGKISVETAYKAMKKRGKLDETWRFIAFGGDGGTYDIGFQSLSGAMERGHDMVSVCYDNEAYMNTGIQRSSSTPHFADTTTTPVGKVVPGKPQQKKNLTKIMVAHGIPYVAQTTFIGNFKDISEKAHKAIYTPARRFDGFKTDSKDNGGSNSPRICSPYNSRTRASHSFSQNKGTTNFGILLLQAPTSIIV